jgi:hypothetical protein
MSLPNLKSLPTKFGFRLSGDLRQIMVDGTFTAAAG